MRKTPMTKARIKILDHMDKAHLSWGFGPHGGREYYFSDGTKVNQGVVAGMIEVGLIKFSEIADGMPSQYLEKGN